MIMIRETILPFKLETTEQKITSHTGLALVAEAAVAVGLPNAFDGEFPAPGSNRGYTPWQFGRACILMLSGGGRYLDDLRELANDEALRETIDLEVPSPDATGDWLRRAGAAAGDAGCNAVIKKMLNKMLPSLPRKEYTLDIDATFIEAHKFEAKYSYHKEKGYYPMTGWLAEQNILVAYEFREGNDSPSARNAQFIELCDAQMPAGCRISMVRSDSAAFCAAVIGYCQKTGKNFLIRASMDSAVKASTMNIPESDWKPLPSDLGPGEYAEFVHAFNDKSVEAFRMVALRRPYQRSFDPAAEQATEGERYFAIATDLDCDAPDVIRQYNARGATEVNIGEHKNGYGAAYAPCGEFEANAVWFGLCAIAYNLGIFLKVFAFGSEWTRYHAVTLRWRIYNTAGKLVRHAGQIILKITGGAEKLHIFEMARHRLYEVYAMA